MYVMTSRMPVFVKKLDLDPKMGTGPMGTGPITPDFFLKTAEPTALASTGHSNQTYLCILLISSLEMHP